MDITFKRVKISNFLSMGEAEVELDNKGYVLVKGINNCPFDNATSNGSGKSTIHDAILWALTGETSRGAKDVTNLFGSDGALVECEFAYGNDAVKIIRTKNHSKYGTNLKIFVNDQDVSGKGIRDSEKIFGEIFTDVDTQLLGNVVLLGQGMPFRFSNNTPAKRKEILEGLSKSDFMIEDVKSRIANRKDELEKQIRDVQNSIMRLETTTIMCEDYKEKCYNEIAELKKSDDALLNEAREAKETLEKQIEETRETISLSKVARNKQNELLLEAMSSNDFEERPDIKAARKTLQDYREKGSAICAQATNIKKQYEMLDGVVDVCPTCGQKIPNVVKIDTTDLHNEYDALKAEFNRITSEGLKINDFIKEQESAYNDHLNEVRNEIRKLITNIDNNIVNLETQLNEKMGHLNNAVAQIARLEEAQANRASRIEELEQEIKKQEEQIVQATVETKTLSNTLDILNERKGIVTKMETLVKRDFRGYLLEGIIGYIGKRAEVYCNDIFGTTNIKFELSANNIDILYDGKAYELLSGGERQKVDIIIQLAIRDMLCALMGFSCNIIVFDEIFDFLDSSGAEALVKTISLRLQDINSIFIVTHHNDIDIPYDNMVTVVKDENRISHIE